jgi:hypothetical protein
VEGGGRGLTHTWLGAEQPETQVFSLRSTLLHFWINNSRIPPPVVACVVGTTLLPVSSKETGSGCTTGRSVGSRH